jgi:hypothetical protein
MCSIYSQELAASASASSEPACEPSRSARSIPTAAPCCESTGQMSLFTTTSEPLPQRALWPTPTVPNGGRTIHHVDQFNGRTAYYKGKKVQVDLNQAVKLTSSAAVSPVRTSPSPARAQDLRASAAAYGRSTPELLARFDRDTSSWKTSQHCFLEGLETFSETWPRSGLVVSGIVFRPVRSAPPIDETESGS